MTASPQISIVIPCYNAAETIAETLASACAQTLTDTEIVVVDDGSTDASAAIVARAAERDGRIRLVRQENGGVARARNVGVVHARARIIAFLDADDLWAPNALAQHLSHIMIRPGLGVSFARVRFMRRDGTDTSTISSGAIRDVSAERFLFENPTATTSTWVVLRRAFEDAGGFDETMRHAEDQEFLFRLLTRTAWKVSGLDTVLVRYRASGGGLSSDLARMEEGWCDLMRRAKALAPQLVDAHGARARAVMMRYLARRAVRLRGGIVPAFAYMGRSIQADWRLAFAEPRRTLLTFAGVCAYPLMPAEATRGG
ncbi:glycosyltransferase family A protein [Xanthobacter sp. KR7-65]|uniref:glycosyltransferase family 2 protein n=1 Tax=Xanthobacter sp. KR7-65 TaxID=3156612 RepID=UPI0032B4070E